MEREELKKRIVRDLNSEEYPFVVEVRGNTVIGRWKVHEVPQDVDEKKLRLFSVKYKLRKDKTFCGGEMTAHRYDYTPPTSTQTKTVYSVSASDNLPWRKRVALKEFPNIGYDAQKLYSIIENWDFVTCFGASTCSLPADNKTWLNLYRLSHSCSFVMIFSAD